MSPVDLWAAAAAAAATCAIALRRFMLKPGLGTWASAPGPVQFGLSILAAALGMRFWSLLGGKAPANEGEAIIYTILAIVSAIMAWNLHATGRDHTGRR